MIKDDTKGQMLEALKPLVSMSEIPDLVALSVSEIKNMSASKLSDAVASRLGEIALVVRSSVVSEDGSHASMAGAYHSVANIMSNDYQSLYNATLQVIASYPNQCGNVAVSDDMVLFQVMIQRPMMSGVVFTHDLNTGAPFDIIQR